MLRDFGRVKGLWLRLVLNTGALGEFRDLLGSGTLVEFVDLGCVKGWIELGFVELSLFQLR